MSEVGLALFFSLLVITVSFLPIFRLEANTEGRAFTRKGLHRAIMRGAVDRVRPKMMTVTAIIAGLPPILWNHETGSEVMQRIAVPMIGGMVSSTLLTLCVIPAVYGIQIGGGMSMPPWQYRHAGLAYS